MPPNTGRRRRRNRRRRLGVASRGPASPSDSTSPPGSSSTSIPSDPLSSPHQSPVPPAGSPIPLDELPIPPGDPRDPPVPAVDPPVPAVDPPVPAVDPPVPAVDPPVPAVDPPVPAVDPPVPAVDPPVPAFDPPVPAFDPPVPAVDPPVLSDDQSVRSSPPSYHPGPPSYPGSTGLPSPPGYPDPPSYHSSPGPGESSGRPDRLFGFRGFIEQPARNLKECLYNHAGKIAVLIFVVFVAAVVTSKIKSMQDEAKITAPFGNGPTPVPDFTSASSVPTVSSTVPTVGPIFYHRILLWTEPDKERRFEGRLLPATGGIALGECLGPERHSLPLDPSEDLSRGCYITKDGSLLNQSDAVVFDASAIHALHVPTFRDPRQVWVLFAPRASARTTDVGTVSTLSFNWTMARRTAADVVLPFRKWRVDDRAASRGYVKKSRKAKSALFFASDCDGNATDQMLDDVMRTLKGTSMRRCGIPHCGSMQMCLTDYAKDYYFLFVPETSGCFENPLEAIYDAFKYGLVPVYFGNKDLDGLPAESYVYAQSLAPEQHVADYLRALMRDLVLYGNRFKWKKAYAYSRDDLCYLCDALQANITKQSTNVLQWQERATLCLLDHKFDDVHGGSRDVF